MINYSDDMYFKKTQDCKEVDGQKHNTNERRDVDDDKEDLSRRRELEKQIRRLKTEIQYFQFTSSRSTI